MKTSRAIHFTKDQLSHKSIYCPLKPNDILNNTYSLIEILGEGSFCQVWKAKNIQTEELYAIKVFMSGSSDKDYFDNELKILIQLKKNRDCPEYDLVLQHVDHFSILKSVFDDYTLVSETAKQSRPRFKHNMLSSQHPCIVTNLMQGSLTDILESFEEGNMPLKMSAQIFRDILLTVEFIHKNDIIHADLNPNNILIKGDIESLKYVNIVVVDFNSSTLGTKPFKPDVGTREYVSPELILDMPFTQKTDIWSLGCIFYELVTNFYLFEFPEDSEESEAEDPEAIEDLEDIEDEPEEDQSVPDNGKQEIQGGETDNSGSSKKQKTSQSDYSDSDGFSDGFNRENNYEHLRMIAELLGKPTKEYIIGGREYYNSKGKLKHNPNTLKIDLAGKLQSINYSKEESKLILDFLFKMIAYDMDTRWSTTELLKHDFIKKYTMEK
jgi:serine/threonine protein kinase